MKIVAAAITGFILVHILSSNDSTLKIYSKEVKLFIGELFLTAKN